MKIEVGKSYRNRRGRKVRVLRDDGHCIYPFDIEGGGSVTREGYRIAHHESPGDLVAEWTDDTLAEGVKHDTGKLPWALLPFDALRGIVQVFQFGAGKYAPRNWEKGMDWSRCFDACLRHLTSWWEGEARDPETGFSHLTHAGCCLLFLIAYEIRGVGKDDRPTRNSP